MKTYKNLFPQVYAFDNLYWAFRAARKAKRGRVAVASDGFVSRVFRQIIRCSGGAIG